MIQGGGASSELAALVGVVEAFTHLAVMLLVGVLAYLGQEIRRDVRELTKKVVVLWDRSERESPPVMSPPFSLADAHFRREELAR